MGKASEGSFQSADYNRNVSECLSGKIGIDDCRSVRPASRLAPGGRLYIVIRRQQGAESALKYLKKANARVSEREKGYWVLCAGGESDE